ncbi:MAG TPA: DUF4010 domain-containing protein [Burkholderiaceae bacterium]
MQFEWLAMAVALGCGLLIGVERERRKGDDSTRNSAGVRTFAVASLAGAIAQALGEPLLVAAGAVLVLALAVVGHWRSDPRDPGFTTELALFVTYLLGVTAVRDATLAAAGAAAVAILLAARSRLHEFSRVTLREAEVRDALILAGAALIVLPLVPAEPIAWLAGVNPRALWGLVVLLLAVQAAGYVAMRVSGARVGLALSGLASGFVSSTATFAAMGARSRADPRLLRAAVGGALVSNVATLLQLGLVTVTVSGELMASIWPIYAAGAAAAIVGAALATLRPSSAAARAPLLDRVFDVRGSLAFAALLTGVTMLAAVAGEHFGSVAVIAAAAVAGTVDVHAAAAAVGVLVDSGNVGVAEGGLPVALAFSTNTASKLIAAWVGGGARFAVAVLPGLIGLLAVVWASWWWIA